MSGVAQDLQADRALAADRVPVARIPWLALSLLALPAALIAVLQLGRLHPDEVFQMLEPAHQFAFGDTVLPWEWEYGLRNWALPGLFGWLLKACAALGIDDPQARRAVLELPQYALHLLSLATVYALVRRRLPTDLRGEGVTDPALWGAALVGLHAPVLHYAGRTLGESVSASLMLCALGLLELRHRPALRYVAGGALLGAAIVVRYGSGVMVAAAGLWLLGQRRVRDALWTGVGGVVPLIGVGLLDLRTWGTPFHSFKAYVGFNVMSRQAAERFGEAPFWWYLPWLLVAVAFWAWPALLAYLSARKAARDARPAPVGMLLFCAGCYLVVISVVAHKEVRFLYPAMVLIATAAAPVWVTLLWRLPQPWPMRGLGLSLAAGLVLIGIRTEFAPQRAGQFQMFVKGARGGTGVVLLHSGTWGAPGHFYSGTRPWLLCDVVEDKRCLRNALADPTFNRVVGWKDEGARALKKAGFRQLERRGAAILWGRPPPQANERLAESHRGTNGS